MNTFEEFASNFFEIFTSNNFYEGKTYLEYIAEPQTNDEANIVDAKIIDPLIKALGFESGHITQNQTGGTKDSSRPDFQVKLSDDYRCFLVEDKHTAYDLRKSAPLKQLATYATSRGYSLGLVCNGRLLLGWDLSNPSYATPVLHLDIQQIVQTFVESGITALSFEQQQALNGLFRRFHRQNFEGIDQKIAKICRPIEEWQIEAHSQANNPNFDELLIGDLKKAIALLEGDVLYQLELLLGEYEDYIKSTYLVNGNGHSKANEELTASHVITGLRKEILNYLRVSGLVEVGDYSWADEKLLEYAQNPNGTISLLGENLLARLKESEQRRESQSNKSSKSIKADQLDLLPPISALKQKEIGIIKPQVKITKLDAKLVEKLEEYQDLVISWQAWQAQQSIKYERAIKAHQFFNSWKDLVTKTIFQDADELKLKTEFARQTAYVYVIRLLMVRICEDKGLINRKFSNGGFKKWKEEVEPQYLDFAQGMSMDYLLEMSYRSAQSIYAHFFSNEDLFNWYHMNANTLIEVLYILNDFNLKEIDSDIIGMVYGRYVTAGKHEQGRYFTPKEVVEYILDTIGYTSDNPAGIRDKKILDLAGGSGSFLVHAARRLIKSYKNPKISIIPRIIRQVKDSLFCMDINPFACYLAETNLLIQVIDLLKQIKESGDLRDCSIDRFNVYNTDSLLLPRVENIRSNLLNPVLDQELSTVSQIKTRTGDFADGFDFVVGNPPYVRADEPNVDKYRRIIEQSGRYETLYEKWDLFVPFVELSCKLTATNGKLGLIVSRGIQSNNYAEKLRDYLANSLTITQVDFLNNIKLFADAVVNNTIFFLENVEPSDSHQTKRLLHASSFDKVENLKSLAQSEYTAKVFKQFTVTTTFENVTDLEDICYCSIGMVLNADEKTAKGQFTKDDLLIQSPDFIHSKKYIDGENITLEFSLDTIRFLEWETERVPSKIRRITIPELYDLPKILFGMTSFPTYDRGVTAGDGFYVPDSVRICVKWEDIYKIKRLEDEPRQMYEFSKKYQRTLGDGQGKKVKIFDRAKQQASLSKKFDLRYIAAILASSFGKRFLLENNRDENIMTTTVGKPAKSRIYPDDLKEFPIKNISLKKQEPFIEAVDNLIAWNWEIHELVNIGHKIQFNYKNDSTRIEVNFFAVLESVNPPSWDFVSAESVNFKVVGDYNQLISKVKVNDDKLLLGRTELLQSNSPLVLEYLKNYLPKFADCGFTWQSLLDKGRIPRTDSDIARVFAECDRLTAEIKEKIEDIRDTYQELDQMVNKLYGV